MVKDRVTVDRQLHVAQQEAKLLQLALEVRADNKLPPQLLGRRPGFSEHAMQCYVADSVTPTLERLRGHTTAYLLCASAAERVPSTTRRTPLQRGCRGSCCPAARADA